MLTFLLAVSRWICDLRRLRTVRTVATVVPLSLSPVRIARMFTDQRCLVPSANPFFGGAQKERRGTKGVLLTCNSSPCSPQSATRLFFAWAGKHSAAGVRREARKPLTSSALYLECRGGTVAWLALGHKPRDLCRSRRALVFILSICPAALALLGAALT